MTWTLKAEGMDSGNQYFNGFGSGWSMENRLFFTEDGGMGTFEVKDIDLKKKTAQVGLNAPSGVAGCNDGCKENDGMTCSDTKVPKMWAQSSQTTLTTTVAFETTMRQPRSGPPRSGPGAGEPAKPGECL